MKSRRLINPLNCDFNSVTKTGMKPLAAICQRNIGRYTFILSQNENKFKKLSERVQANYGLSTICE